jgi:hypothetical protein
MSSIGSSLSTTCQCNAGYTGANGGLCLACVAGSYKPTTGPLPCTFCAVDFYSTSSAAASAASCVACPVNSDSVAGSGSIELCYCAAGYKQTEAHDACEECAPGYYDSTNRFECSKCAGGLYSVAVGATDDETCQPCDSGSWSAEGSPTCEGCPANSNSPPESALYTDCTCNAGATGSDGQTCMLCEPGEYKAIPGSAACSPCPANSISPTGSSVLDQLPVQRGVHGCQWRHVHCMRCGEVQGGYRLCRVHRLRRGQVLCN